MLNKYALICVAGLALASCGVSGGLLPVEPTNAPVAAPSGLASHSVADEKALYAAEAFYNVPASLYVKADTAGLLTPARKAVIKPIMLKLYDGLLVARKAYAAFNSAGLISAVANLKALSGQAKSLLA